MTAKERQLKRDYMREQKELCRLLAENLAKVFQRDLAECLKANQEGREWNPARKEVSCT